MYSGTQVSGIEQIQADFLTEKTDKTAIQYKIINDDNLKFSISKIVNPQQYMINMPSYIYID